MNQNDTISQHSNSDNISTHNSNISSNNYMKNSNSIHKKKKKFNWWRLCNFCFNALTLSFITISFFIFTYMYFDTIYQKGSFMSIINNWEQPVIESIHIIEQIQGATTEANCPADHPIVMSSFQWAGSGPGCECFGGGYDNHKCCFGGFCKVFTCEGEDIEPTEPQDLNVWATGTQEYTVCGKAIPEITMANFHNYMTKDGQCKDQENYKLCQSQNKDKNLNICVPNLSECPIRALKIAAIEDDMIPLGETFDMPDYKYINLESKLQNFAFMYSQFADTFPVVQFQIADGQQICLNESYKSLTSKKDYTLIQQRRKLEECEEDNRWISIQNMVEEEFFDINNDFTATAKKLSGYDVSDHFKYSFMYKGYNPISLAGRVNFLSSQDLNFQDFYDDLEHVQQKTGYLMFYSMVLLLFYAFVEVLMSLDLRPTRFYGLVFYNIKNNKIKFGSKLTVFCIKCLLVSIYFIKIFMLNQDALDLRNSCELYVEKNYFLGDQTMLTYLDTVGSHILRGSLFTFLMGGWLFLMVLEPNFTYFVYKKLRGQSLSVYSNDPEESQQKILEMRLVSSPNHKPLDDNSQIQHLHLSSNSNNYNNDISIQFSEKTGESKFSNSKTQFSNTTLESNSPSQDINEL